MVDYKVLIKLANQCIKLNIEIIQILDERDYLFKNENIVQCKKDIEFFKELKRGYQSKLND